MIRSAILAALLSGPNPEFDVWFQNNLRLRIYSPNDSTRCIVVTNAKDSIVGYQIFNPRDTADPWQTRVVCGSN